MADGGSPSSTLSDEELSAVASEVGDQYFRAGLLLGMQPHKLDRLQAEATRQAQTTWQLNMQLLQLWKERTSAECERLELAKVLKRLGKGRVAVTIDASVRDWDVTSAIDPTGGSLTAQELEEVSRGVCDCWRRLAVYLKVPDARVQALETSGEDIVVKAFRCLWAWREAGENVSRASLAQALRNVDKGRLASRIFAPAP